jgi:flagellar biosynthesis anti-sigma factor FlgM
MTIKLISLDPRLTAAANEPKNPVQSGAADGASRALRDSVGARPVEMSSVEPPSVESPSVEVTEASRQLAGWIRESSGSASVDEAKVARLRVEIEHGTYRLDSTRIADELLTRERELLRLMDRD